MLVFSLLACAKQAPAEPKVAEAPSSERAHARKAGAPVELQAEIRAAEAQITATFGGDSTDVQISAWGASGLQVAGEKLRWQGPVKVADKHSFTVEHEGTGDLAVRVVGTFHGERIDEVRSWTVGARKPTPVPVQEGSKGWDATRR